MTAKLLNNKGNVVIFTIPVQSNLKDRLQGYQSAFADHTEVKVMQVIDMNGNSDMAFDNTKKLLGQQGENRRVHLSGSDRLPGGGGCGEPGEYGRQGDDGRDGHRPVNRRLD